MTVMMKLSRNWRNPKQNCDIVSFLITCRSDLGFLARLLG